MHRTEGENNESNMFVNGPPGTFIESNWANAVQEEIANFIEQAGDTLLEASTDTRDQLWNALLTAGIRFATGTVMLFGQNSAPVGWTKYDILVDKSMLMYGQGNIGDGGSADPTAVHNHKILLYTGNMVPYDNLDQGSGSNTCAHYQHIHYVNAFTDNNVNIPKYALTIAGYKN